MGNDYENIQKLYEEGYRGLDYNPGPNAKYTANMSPNGYSYRKGQLPTGYPGAGGYSQYNYAQAGGYQVPTVTVIADERWYGVCCFTVVEIKRAYYFSFSIGYTLLSRMLLTK